MSESTQPLIAVSSDGRAQYSGLEPTTLQNSFGPGTVVFSTTFVGELWMRIRRNTATNDVFGHWWGVHNFLYAFLDPTRKGPPYIVRIAEVVTPSFGVSVGRIFFGFGEFTDVTDATSLRGLGFYCDETGNWFALLRDALGDRVRVDTLANTTQPRRLRIDIDGNLNSVRWYVDEVLVHTVTLTTQLDQISSTAGSGDLMVFYDVAIQSAAGNQIDCYIAAGPQIQMSLVTNEAEPAATPPPGGQLTYQRICNLAMTRAPEFKDLVLDDQQTVDEMDAIVLELVQEGSDADHTAFQHAVNWKTDILPTLTVTPAPADLSKIDRIEVPRYVNTLYSAEGIKSDGTKTEILVSAKETEIRSRALDQDSVLFTDLRDPTVRRPRALKLWNPALSVWELVKDESGFPSASSPWKQITDANLVVSGVPVRIGLRANLTNTVPLPYRALVPMAEIYALSLGGRVGKDSRWMIEQRKVAEDAKVAFREFINMMDMATDEPFDPEIGML